MSLSICIFLPSSQRCIWHFLIHINMCWHLFLLGEYERVYHIFQVHKYILSYVFRNIFLLYSNAFSLFLCIRQVVYNVFFVFVFSYCILFLSSHWCIWIWCILLVLCLQLVREGLIIMESGAWGKISIFPLLPAL